MKRQFIILICVIFSMACGCNTMKAVEQDMNSLLEHMEIDSLSDKSTANKNSTATAANTESSAQSRSTYDSNAKKSPDIGNSLTIRAIPKESTIKIMNIKSRYYPGIRLASGKYDILVEHAGYKTYREWVSVEYSTILKVILKKQAEAYMTKSVDTSSPQNSKGTGEVVYSESSPGNGSESLTIAESGSVETEAVNRIEEPAAAGLPSTLTGHYGTVSSLCFSPDGTLLASGGYDSIVILWSMADGRVVHHLKHGDRVNAVAFSPDGRIVASAGSDKTVKLWDVATGDMIKTLTGHTGRIHSVAFDTTGKRLVSGSNNELIIWDVSSGKISNLIVGDDKLYPRFGTIYEIAFNPTGRDVDGYEFAFTCQPGIALFNPETKQLLTLNDTSTPHSVAYRSDGQYIVWGARHYHREDEFFPRFVRTDTKQRDPALSKDDELAKADRIFYTTYTPDGNHLIMLTYNQAVLYDINTGAVVRKFPGTSETAVTDAALSPDGHILAATAKNVIKIWKID